MYDLHMRRDGTLGVSEIRLSNLNKWQHINVLRRLRDETPVALLTLIPLNFVLAMTIGQVYALLGVLQILFYCFALLGWLAQKKQLKYKVLYIPMYFMMMNISALLGIRNFFLRRGTVLWEKSLRLK